jgi:hypothetical protein
MNALNPALHTDALRRPLKRPNALHPNHMTAQERLAEICSLLALALARPNVPTGKNPSEKMAINAGALRQRNFALPLKIESNSHE